MHTIRGREPERKQDDPPPPDSGDFAAGCYPFHPPIIPASASTPSVSAAGPGCRISADFTSYTWPPATAGISPHPGLATTRSGRNFRPHHDPMITSGARRTTSSGSAMIRSFARPHSRNSGKAVLSPGELDQLGHPANPRDQGIVPLLEVDARAAGERRGPLGNPVEPGLQFGHQRLALLGTAHQPRDRPHGAQDLRHRAVVEDVHLDTGTDQFGGDVGLDVGEAEDQVRFQREDPVDLRRCERRDLGLLLARTRGAHGKTGDADDARVLAQAVEDLGRFLGQADDAVVHGGETSPVLGSMYHDTRPDSDPNAR